jgi:hypothetical protein
MGPHAPIFRSAIAALILSVSLTAPVVRRAQAEDTATDPAPDPGSEVPRYHLDPVVVTADRFPIRLLSTAGIERRAVSGEPDHTQRANCSQQRAGDGAEDPFGGGETWTLSIVRLNRRTLCGTNS